ncbi:hypothetical protein C2E25_04205 [Geothermobacter hydrogeniphilus]|uniref:DUF1566 domain-containing protein n=1 Tax=Geothermobacter hydrogeniphilus TaxID=1969733 RepID=A0A2K2HCH2_9BACT|nr:DUF1566 domain-containing protein [Geothermobacter hydrogeniphilus]PNU21012.1 hypothetical protein C2E25_04205 [Geothermobacter hydrogeniphilus]
MQGQRIVIATLFIVICCSGSLFALSPEIRFDMLKTKLTQQLKEQQYARALETIHEIRGLGIATPASLDYFEGKALFESGKKYEAYETLTNYVESNGKNARYYRQAIAYLVKAEEAYNAEKEKREAERAAREKAAREEREKDMALRRQAQEFAQEPAYGTPNNGLMWSFPLSKGYLANPYLQGQAWGTKQEARNYCENLDLAGHSDWRVPDMQEFSTVAGKGNKYSSLPWPAHFKVWLWGRQEFSGRDTRYQANQLYAVSNNDMQSYDEQSAAIICVRRNSPEMFEKYFSRQYRVVKFKGHKIMVEDRYMISSDQCFYRDPEVTFSAANKYCKNLKLGGYDDWHLPIKEDMLQRLPCEIAAYLSFLVDDSSYNDLWYVEPGLLRNKPGVHDPGECKIRLEKYKRARHHVRCVRDVK